MSFSKAKIQRFNDIKPCAPSPATYNLFKDKTKGGSSQVDRCVDPKSPVVSETGSTHSTPCFFRTPSLLKRKKNALSLKTKPKELFTDDLQILKDKIVECENKDAFIKDLQEEIEVFKEKMCELRQQKHQLDLDKIEYDERIVKLKIEHDNNLKTLTEKYEQDMSKANQDKNKITEEFLSIKEEYNKLKEANRQEMAELKENCDKFQLLYNQSVEEHNKLLEEKDAALKNKEQELRALEENCIEMQRKHSLEIEKIQKEHQIEIQDIEFEMLKTMTELQKEKECAANSITELETKMRKQMEDMQRGFDEEKQRILMKTENRVRQIEENFRIANLFTEAQLKEKLDELDLSWKTKLETQEKQAEAILKECQAISEYNIIQCELEKNEALNNLTEKTKELESVQLKYDEIVKKYNELDKRFEDLNQAIYELKQTKETVGDILEVKNKELKKLSDEKRTYEVTIRNSQVTIDVLTKRLIHSDRDVEQLKTELSNTEVKTLEYENRCVQLTNDLKQAQTFNEELEMQYESAIKLNTTEIEQLKTELVGKVDAYKSEVSSLTRQLREEKELSREIYHQLHEAYEMVEKVKVELEHLEMVNSNYQFDVEQTQNELEDYRIREMDWSDHKEKLENIIKEMENLLDTKQDEIRDLKYQLSQLQENSETHLQSLQYYKNKVEECEKELDETAHIHRKYIEQSGRYDELLQRFEQLEMENTKGKNKYTELSKDMEEKSHLWERYSKQKEMYENLLKKYEQLEKDYCANKKKLEKQKSVHDKALNQIETERDVLLGRVDYLETELKEVSENYADLVGHHNSSQKIKHLMDLKIKNEELIQTNMDLEVTIKGNVKALEKLKKENADLKKCLRKNKGHIDDKENVGSPNRSLNSSRIESPFRERN